MAHPAIMALPCAECGLPGDHHTDIGIERCKVKALVRECKKLTDENKRLKKHLADDRFCMVHGAEGCIECEKRCEGCGDDGEMTIVDGERLCENCVYEDEQDAAAEACS